MTKNPAQNKPITSSDIERLIVATALDIKAPLGLISGIAAHLQNESISPQDTRQLLARLELMCDLVVDSVEGLILSAQVHTEQVLEQEPVSIGLVIDETLHHFEPLAHAYHQELRLKRPRKLPPVVANKVGLQQVLSRLIELAIRGADGESQIQLLANRNGDNIRTSITDSSHRLPTDNMPSTLALVGRVLQPKPGHSTSGSSLFIADQLGRLMGGTFGVETKGRLQSLYLQLPTANQIALL